MKKIFCRILLSAFVLVEVFTLISIHKDNRLFDSIVEEVANKSSEQQNVLALLDWTHTNVKVANTRPLTTPRYILTHGSCCGGFTKVLAVLAGRAGLSARPLFLYRDGIPMHVVTEVDLRGRWIVFDPMYGYSFPVNDTLLATAEDLRTSPELLEQVADKEKYPLAIYTYQDVKRTNWNKIPVILPAIYGLLRAVIGDKADQIALNRLTLRPKIAFGYLLLFPIVVLLTLLVRSKMTGVRR